MVFLQIVGDQGSFQEKLRTAVQEGYITQQNSTTLQAAIEAGNAAAHRGFTPNEQQIEDVLGIVEHLIEGLYILSPRSDRLRGQVPPRTI